MSVSGLALTGYFHLPSSWYITCVLISVWSLNKKTFIHLYIYNKWWGADFGLLLILFRKASNKQRTRIDTTRHYQLHEVTVTGNGSVSTVNKSAYNGFAVNTQQMQNSTKTLSDALRQIPGLKLRETGGVGGSANIMLDGMDSKGENDCTWNIRHLQNKKSH